MKLPPELRLQVYEAVFEDTFDDTVHKGTLDDFPRSGIRPRLSHRAALRRHIKTVMAILQTCRTVRAEGAAMAFQIFDRYAKSASLSLKQLGANAKPIHVTEEGLEGLNSPRAAIASSTGIRKLCSDILIYAQSTKRCS